VRLLFIAILLFAFLVAAPSATAQTYLFDYFTANDGIPSNWITTVFQDSRGYIWAGGDGGISVYDGATFKAYGTAEGLPIALVWSISESRVSPGTMFVGVHNSGLSMLKDGLFTTMKLDSVPVTVSAIEEDRGGAVWCATGLGLFRVKNGSASRVRVVSYTGGISLLYQLSDGSLLISQDSTLVRYFPQTGKSVPILRNEKHFMCAVEATDNTVWLGTLEGEIIHIANDKIVASKKTSIRELRTVAGDHEGNLWFATLQGVAKVATKNFPESEIVLLTESNGLQELDINACLIDREDNLWVGGRSKGLSKLPYRNIIRFEVEGLHGDLLNGAAVADRLGHIFAATREGIYEIWNELGWRSYLHKLPPLPQQNVNKEAPLGWASVSFASDGLLWACFNGGGIRSYRVEHREGSHSVLTPMHALRSGIELPRGLTVGGLVSDNDQYWMSLRPGVLVQIDLRTRKVHTVYDLGPEPGGGGTAQALSASADGTFWVGAFAGGVYVYGRNENTYTLRRKYTVEDGLADNRVRSIVQRRNGEIWIGTRFSGISVLKDGKFRSINAQHGLLNNAVWKMFEDDDGRLWVGTSVGLQYTSRDGDSLFVHTRLSGTQIRGIGQIPGKKMLWTVTAGALTLHDYTNEEKSHVPPLIYVSGLRANGIDKDLHDELVLSSAESFCVVRYAGLSFKDERGVRYRHRLIGLDTTWNEPIDQRAVTFGSLGSGSYTFEVKAITSDGTESIQPAKLAFTILPPWYRSPWTIALYLLFGSLAMFLYIKIRTQQLEQRSIKLEQMVNERTVEVVQQRNRLREQAEKLREIDSLKSHFFTNISHEFRTPLTVILGHLDRLLKQRDGGPENTFHVMNRNARRLLHLINELLDLSKLEAGAMTLRASKADVAEFTRKIAAMLDSFAEHKEIKLTLNGEYVAQARGLPAIYAYVDGDKLEKVLYNLLSNALKFTPRSGSVDVSVSTGNSDAQTQYVQIAVADTGKGISERNLPYVFDRFFQGDDSGKTEVGGTGIGLALVKELVELHHGTVNVKSVDGRGSTFTVQLPLGTSHLDAGEIVEGEQYLEPPDLKLPLEVEDAMSRAGETELPDDATRILIVEDNADLRNFIREQLKDEFAIIEAANGSDGVKKAEEFIPDLVISDIMMPEMNGYQLCAAIKMNEKLNHIPVMLLTAKATTEDKLEGLELGADDYLMKPFDSRELKLRARNLIQTRRTLREKFTSEMLLKPSAVTVPSAQRQFLERVTSAIEKHLAEEELSVESLAEEIGLSRAQLHRKLKAITNKSPNELIRSFRLQRAAELIRQDVGSLAEIAYQVGFSSQAYFTRCFVEEFKVTPTEFRKTSNTENAPQ
jgi:signal transduction histidine kinase/DNA-binding response OmpR family regulator/ligand-binding sensor domain-containing protein